MRIRWLSATINLAGLDLPDTATVEIEAYFRSSSMRFPCGTVAEIAVPSSMVLSEIDRGGAVRFRLLVIDAERTGRIIAAADGLRPAVDRNSPDRQSLLPLRETDLGDQLWKVDVDFRSGPTLLVNGTIAGLASRLREQALLQGLILPHALRMVLMELGRGGDQRRRRYLAQRLAQIPRCSGRSGGAGRLRGPGDSRRLDRTGGRRFLRGEEFANRVKLDAAKVSEDHA